MNISLFTSGRFLITPPIHEDESLRGYAVRVSQCNDSFFLVRPVLTSLSMLTAAIPVLSKLTGNSEDVLRAHGCSVSDQRSNARGVRFGNVTLPEGQVWMSRRKLCPLCLVADGVSRSYWELSLYSVCHKHGTYMVGQCHDCKRIFSWDSCTPSTCVCGIHMTDMKTKAVRSSNKQNFCNLIAESLRQTIQFGDSKKIKKNYPRMIFVDWVLLMIEFITNVLIPKFWKEYRTDTLNLGDADRQGLIVSILRDRNYCDYLRETLFLHAAKDPMTLIKALRPGNRPKVILQLLGGCIDEISFHESLWRVHRSTPIKEVNRKIYKPQKTQNWQIVTTERRTPNGKLLPRQRASDPGGITWRPKRIRQLVGVSVKDA